MGASKKHTIDALFVIVVFCLFAAGVLMVLLFGTGIYKTMRTSSEAAFGQSTGATYVMEKLRQGDAEGTLSVSDFDECSALYIRTESGGVRYKNIIYCYDGYIRELYCEDSLQFAPEDGEKIVEASILTFLQKDGSILFELTGESGRVTAMSFCQRSGGSL